MNHNFIINFHLNLILIRKLIQHSKNNHNWTTVKADIEWMEEIVKMLMKWSWIWIQNMLVGIWMIKKRSKLIITRWEKILNYLKKDMVMKYNIDLRHKIEAIFHQILCLHLMPPLLSIGPYIIMISELVVQSIKLSVMNLKIIIITIPVLFIKKMKSIKIWAL